MTLATAPRAHGLLGKLDKLAAGRRSILLVFHGFHAGLTDGADGLESVWKSSFLGGVSISIMLASDRLLAVSLCF